MLFRSDRAVLEEFPDDEHLRKWITMAGERVAFQGLPARICWLGYGDRAKFGLKINALVRDGAISAPIVIGRDHLDTGSVASPNRETEGMRDGSDAIADWPIFDIRYDEKYSAIPLNTVNPSRSPAIITHARYQSFSGIRPERSKMVFDFCGVC